MEGLIELLFGMPRNIADKKEYHRTVLKVLSTISHREAIVLYLRVAAGMTLKQTGISLGVTPERVRQIEARAKRILRHPTKSRHLLNLTKPKAIEPECGELTTNDVPCENTKYG